MRKLRIKKILCVTLLQFLLFSSAFALTVNDPAPMFSLRDIKEKDFYLSDLVGPTKKENSNGVILSFFASWCTPCRNELKIINSLVDEMKDKGIEIVIVGFKEDPDTIGTLLAELKVNKPVVLCDRDGKVGETYGVRFLPTTFFIGSDGIVKNVAFGEIKDERELREKAGKLSK
ncbi:MAG TPA: redoxin domain-containing protein [Nitrospirota bacterium]|nr:redoxin domain-containing protein [Nitrospirota bacterium]